MCVNHNTETNSHSVEITLTQFRALNFVEENELVSKILQVRIIIANLVLLQDDVIVVFGIKL